MYRGGLAMAALAACQFSAGTAAVDAPAGSLDALLDSAAPDAATIGGLVAWYPMNDVATNGVVLDKSGRGHNGQCVGSCPALTAGHSTTNGYKFTGQRIDVAAATGELMTMPAFTVSLWARLDLAAGVYACPINKGVGPAGANSWQFCLTNVLQPYFETTHGQTADVLTDTAIATGVWHHYALSWDGMTMMKVLWVDGANAMMHGQVVTDFDDRPITIGADVDSPMTMTSTAVFVGALDEIRIYNRALTATEIATLAAGGS